MNRLSIVTEGPGHFIVDGDLTFSAMDKKIIKSFRFLSSAKRVVIDLGGVGNTDSGGLALLIEWLKVARSKRVQLEFRNIPEQILNLAKLSGLDICGYSASCSPAPTDTA